MKPLAFVAPRATTSADRSSLVSSQARVCPVCGTLASLHEVVRWGCCPKPACRTSLLQQRWRERREREHRTRLSAAVAFRDRWARRAGRLNPHSLEYGMVPANELQLGPLPRARREALRDHLNGVLAQLVREDAKVSRTTDGRVGVPEEPSLVQRSCALCRGFCCAQGGTQAFLDLDTLQRVRQRAPRLSVKKLRKLYLDRLPTRTVSGSCVFHGAGGCALPRELRADICNDFRCTDLKRVLAAGAGQSEGRPLLLISVMGSKVSCAGEVRGR